MTHEAQLAPPPNRLWRKRGENAYMGLNRTDPDAVPTMNAEASLGLP